MKKRFLLMGVAAALVLATVTGGTLAAGVFGGDSGATVAAPMQASNLAISLNDNATQSEKLVALSNGSELLMPGDTVDATYTVTNTGAESAYVRIKVYGYWVAAGKEDEGEPVTPMAADASTTPAVNGMMDASLLAMTASGDWLEAEAIFDGGVSADGAHIFYCKAPVASGDDTAALTLSVTLSLDAGEDCEGQQVALLAQAEAVQYLPGADYAATNKDGILAAWGVDATLDANGSIASIKQ